MSHVAQIRISQWGGCAGVSQFRIIQWQETGVESLLFNYSAGVRKVVAGKA